jgi:uncharacterized protein YvpB
MRTRIPFSIGILATLLLAACGSQYQVVYPLPSTSSDSSHSSDKSSALSASSASPASSVSSASSVPTSVLINVPFQTQAPLENWDAVHEQACEEASLALVHDYLNGQTVTPQQMEEQISTIISYESEHGYAQDVTVEQLREIAAALFGLRGTVMTDVTTDSIKKELAAGHPVIIPAAGRMLHNPYFSGEGPWYHMLVVIGYDDANFITNDVGTKRGAQYKYPYDTLITAIHDWTGADDMIATGPKRALVLTK